MRGQYKEWETTAGGIRSRISFGGTVWAKTVLLGEDSKIYGWIKNQFTKMYWL